MDPWWIYHGWEHTAEGSMPLFLGNAAVMIGIMRCFVLITQAV